jgi:CelD/BcsL family acetyltransferase involved in cellulose biosynthesis
MLANKRLGLIPIHTQYLRLCARFTLVCRISMGLERRLDMRMISCESVAPSDLSLNDIAAWRDMTRQTPLFASPVLSPDFCLAVAKVRNDVRVTIFRKAGKAYGFLAHHYRPGKFARPVGAPFADYTALISFPEINLSIEDALAMADISSLQVLGLIDPYGVFGAFEGEPEEAYGIDLAHNQTSNLNNLDKKHLKNINRLRRKLEADLGDIRFVTPDFNPLHFEAMLKLKREQTLLTGIHDFLSPDWVNSLMRSLFIEPKEGVDHTLYGHMTTLMAGEKALCYHFGPRLGSRIHPWISTFDPQFSTYSPGQIFLNDCQSALKAMGITYYDLSTGQQHYKESFCNHHFTVKRGRAFAASVEGRQKARTTRWLGQTESALGARLGSGLKRLGHRLDHIASLELDMNSRIEGTLFALLSARKRLKSHG